MTAKAGGRARATDLGFTGADDYLASDYNVTTTLADVGPTVDVETVDDNEIALATITVQLKCNTSTTNHNVAVKCVVDGTAETETLYWVANTYMNGQRITCQKSWRIDLGTAGTHTLKMQASCTTNSDFTIMSVHSGIIVVPSR